MKRWQFTAGALAAAATATLSAPSSAEDGYAYEKQYVLDLGAGVKYKPKYPGADDYIFAPLPLVAVSRFYIPGIGSVGGKKSGFRLFPSFDFTGERKPSDSAALATTSKIDWAIEAGLGVAYRYDYLRGFVAVRQGFNGHHGQVVDIGLDVITQPTDRIGFVIGPRATWASDDYMSTYFGVSAGEASPALPAYSADAGFKSVGVEARATYAVTEKTTFHLRGGWERFVGDAEDSPIVQTGDENQFWVGAGLSYKFAFDLFR